MWQEKKIKLWTEMQSLYSQGTYLLFSLSLLIFSLDAFVLGSAVLSDLGLEY
jgi:hypothetical protein